MIEDLGAEEFYAPFIRIEANEHTVLLFGDGNVAEDMAAAQAIEAALQSLPTKKD
jgi:hypothetical protein